MSAAIPPHPRFAELRDLFRTHPEWFAAWQGTLYRFQAVDFPTPGDVLSGHGARRRGGRWNPPGLATLYGSTTDLVALEECKANDLELTAWPWLKRRNWKPWAGSTELDYCIYAG